MKAIHLTAYGNPDQNSRMVEVSEPNPPSAGEALVRCLIAIAKARDLNIVGIVRRSELIPELEGLGIDFVGVESPELSKQIQTATGGMPIHLGLDAVGG
jgi:NADPH:quinone reductase-like Zn-dependent oxidoreductase